MFRKSFRIVYALLIAFIAVAGMIGPAQAQSIPVQADQEAEYQKVKVVNQDGWSAFGRHSAADDFVIVCPTGDQQLPEPNHPCNSDSNSARWTNVDDFVLVCPIEEVIESHPCAKRKAQIIKARPNDYVLVCPIEQEFDEKHPCNETNSQMAQFEFPSDKVLTCPFNPLREPNHPCNRNAR